MKTIKTIILIAAIVSLSASCTPKHAAETAAEAGVAAASAIAGAEPAVLQNEPEEAEAGRSVDERPIDFESYQEEYLLRNWEEMGPIEPDAHWATAYAAENVRLRSAPDNRGDNIILAIPQGSRLTVTRRGPPQTIDGMKEPWFNVVTEDGVSGWAYSGYLTPGGESGTAGTRDYSKLLSGDFSDFAKGTWGDSGRRLRADGTFRGGEAATVPRRNSDGSYSWGIYNEDGGIGAILWPAGVEIKMNMKGIDPSFLPDGVELDMNGIGILPSDITKVRMAAGHELYPGSEIMYYHE